MTKLLLSLLLLGESSLLMGGQGNSPTPDTVVATNPPATAVSPGKIAGAQAALTAPRVPTTAPDGSKYRSDTAQNGKQSGAEKLASCEKRVSEFKDKPCDIIFIGDSITQLWQDSKRGGLPIWNQQYEPRHALNFGIGGDSIQNVLWRLDTMDIKSLRPRVAVILIGTNNKGNTPGEIAEGVKAVIAKTQETFAGVKIILVSILPSKRASAGEGALALELNEKMMSANGILKGYADGRSVYWLDLVPLMPLVTATAPDGSVVANFKGLGSDRLHPDGMGYLIWADAMEPLLTKLLAESK